MSMFALLLARDTALKLDMAHVLELALTHDLVETYAGDTYIHLVDARLAARVREEEAADRLFAILPDDLQQRLHDWWIEFEEGDSEEARFARAMDRLQGFNQNLYVGGRVWRERGVSEDMTRVVNQAAIDLDPAIAEIYRLLYERARRDNMWIGTGTGEEATIEDAGDDR